MIEIKNKKICEIPVLEIAPQGSEGKKLPLAFFYHGWTSCKETAMVNGYEIAKRGIRVVMPDALYHGERKDALSTEEHYGEFWQIVLKNIDEFPVLCSHYQEQGIIDSDQIGVSGLSMGGITTCGLLATYEKISAAVCLMGTPKMTEFAEFTFSNAQNHGLALPESVDKVFKELKLHDLSLQPEKIAGRPLHFWHGTKDETVPFDPTYDFYLKIQEESWAKHVSFTITKDGHKVPFAISAATGEFFKENLIK